jgi:uncharacterized repeat protein (TIGR03943 family)
VRRETQNMLLLLLGGALLKICLNGQYLRYVKPSLLPWLIACGAVAVLLAVIGIARDLLAPRGGRASGGNHAAYDAHHAAYDAHPIAHDGHQTAHDGHQAAHDGHQHSSRSPWLLILPVLAIFLIAPPALGADKVARSGDRSVVAQQPKGESNVDFAPLPDEEAPLLKIGDVVTRAIWDDSGSLDGTQVRLVGFVVKGTDGSNYLARLVIGCCAADATPVKVKLDGGQTEQYPPDTWLQVRGEVQPGTANEGNGYSPTFAVSQADQVQQPPDPYEF